MQPFFVERILLHKQVRLNEIFRMHATFFWALIYCIYPDSTSFGLEIFSLKLPRKCTTYLRAPAGNVEDVAGRGRVLAGGGHAPTAGPASAGICVRNGQSTVGLIWKRC